MHVSVTMDNVDVTMDDVDVTMDDVDVTMDNVNVTRDNADVTMDNAKVTVDDIDAMIKACHHFSTALSYNISELHGTLLVICIKLDDHSMQKLRHVMGGGRETTLSFGVA